MCVPSNLNEKFLIKRLRQLGMGISQANFHFSPAMTQMDSMLVGGIAQQQINSDIGLLMMWFTMRITQPNRYTNRGKCMYISSGVSEETISEVRRHFFPSTPKPRQCRTKSTPAENTNVSISSLIVRRFHVTVTTTQICPCYISIWMSSPPPQYGPTSYRCDRSMSKCSISAGFSPQNCAGSGKV